MDHSASTELIDRYLHGQLTEDERQAFEARCRDDAAFADEVRRQVAAEYTAREMGREARRAEFNALYDELAPPAPGRIRRLWTRGAIATAVAAGLALLVLFAWPDSPSAQDLYVTYQGDAPVASFYKGEAEAGTTYQRFAQALAAYNQGQYLAAMPILEALLADSTFERPNTAHFFLGLSYLYAHDEALADGQQPDVTYLSAAIQELGLVEAGSGFAQQAQWQLALAYLRADRPADARATLREIVAQEGHYRQQQATDLLAALTPTP